MTLDDAGDTGWAKVKAFCESEIDALELESGYQNINEAAAMRAQTERQAIQRIIEFIEENAP